MPLGVLAAWRPIRHSRPSLGLYPRGMGDLTQVYLLIVVVLVVGLAVSIDYQRRKNRRD